MSELGADYLSGRSELAAFYGASPQAAFECPPARPWAPGVAESVREFSARIGVSTKVAGIEAAVLTGHQPCLLAGPLFTVYKAATAVRLARLLRERHGVACVPVFWVAGDDHDFHELSQVHLLTQRDEPLELAYRPSADVRERPMYHVPLEASLHDLIDLAAGSARGSEFRAEVAAFLHESLDASAHFSEWSARILAKLFESSELAFFDPSEPRARNASVPIIARAIQAPLVTTERLMATGTALSQLGYTPSIQRGGRECAFFLELDGRRARVLYEDGRFHAPGHGKSWTESELLALLEAEPGRFSPNVALRPILQQHLFPVAAYIGGPGEIAYWAQLRGVFEAFQLSMPPLLPCARAVLTTPKWRKLLRESGLSYADLTLPSDALLELALRNTASESMADIADAQRRVETAARELAARVAFQGGPAAGLAETFEGGVLTQLERLERGLLRADAARLDTARARVSRLGNVFAPLRKPQERVYSVFSFLFQYGWGLVPRIVDALDIASFELNEVEL